MYFAVHKFVDLFIRKTLALLPLVVDFLEGTTKAVYGCPTF
jgi:hypothetical protein